MIIVPEFHHSLFRSQRQVISPLLIFRSNSKSVLNVQTNGIHTIHALSIVKKGKQWSRSRSWYRTIIISCRYGIKNYTPDAITEKRRRRMLKKYPLPSNWREVPDANLDRCYYWNLETDEVSWLPPSHPRSHITESAIKLRRKKDKRFSEDDMSFCVLLDKEMERKVAEAQRQAAGPSKKKKKKNKEDVRELQENNVCLQTTCFRLENDLIRTKKIWILYKN